jgi:uncharacterized protein (DUF486 family)
VSVLVVVVSRGIAFADYCLAVPANRIGSAVYSPAEPKTIQEVITLIVFACFTAVYFDEPLNWTQAAGFALIALCSTAKPEQSAAASISGGLRPPGGHARTIRP